MNLKLGDDFFTTKKAKKGHLFSCQDKNSSAPGSDIDKITWINFTAGTWNVLDKLWLPQGDFLPQQGFFEIHSNSTTRTIKINNLPVDRKIGDWPMSDYALLHEIDRNPGIPQEQLLTFNLSKKPTIAATPSCLPLGAIGITLNGVILYNAADARGNDAVAHEIVDVFGGHPAQEAYHYHFIPERLDATSLEDGHSGLVGYIRDGFPIYGYKGTGGMTMKQSNLDICHGHTHNPLGYHYHATLEYPYTAGCYKGRPPQSSNTPRQPRPPKQNRPSSAIPQ